MNLFIYITKPLSFQGLIFLPAKNEWIFCGKSRSQKVRLLRIFLCAEIRKSGAMGGFGMKMELFPHNQSAYAAALAMLSATGKAAVVHPTGTGKSFIAWGL